MVGTVKKNKPELAAEILQVKDRAPLSSKFVFTDTTTVVSYCPKKTPECATYVCSSQRCSCVIRK